MIRAPNSWVVVRPHRVFDSVRPLSKNKRIIVFRKPLSTFSEKACDFHELLPVCDMDSAQCRAARALLKWTQEDLAARSGASAVTIRNFENDRSVPQTGTRYLLQKTLENAGIEFIPENGGGVGVRLSRRSERT
ncbi:helix-turn-helix transcriptional regulator [Mesorhizobium sp.]|uniref:helix-turn-helix domain-containing protein n=1 Tax=Mesorhizobium sp. TaxID=1871066 RepID=UPI0025C6E5DB|nr:helix-turn-helix transcriptional regulator [Mesorhizobium sp.]